LTRSVTALAALALAATLAGCASWGNLFGTKNDPRKDWGAQEYYNAAKDELNNGNWNAAVKLYEQLEAKFPFGRFAQQAQIEVAYAHYKEGDTAQALSAIERFMKLHPNHPNYDYALYLKGLVNFKEDLGPLARVVSQDLADRDPKAAKESFEVFKELVNRFPESRYASDARARMAYLVEALARHEVHVATYYLKRGAYLAAANRAQDVLTRFPNASAEDRRQSLEIMVAAYDKMGMKDLSDDAKKVLVRNYPDAATPKSGSWWKFWN
jgi:outer membrane protein assembly factor BamD